MKKYAVLIMAAVFLLTAETLFQVKDSDDNVVLDVSKDGLRVYNEGDLLMEISSSDIRAFIDNDPQKGLARSFSVTTSSSSKGETNVFEISKDATQMREGDQGQQYTDFSPQNVFLGLNAGASTTPGSPNAHSGITNIFLGNESGINNTSGGFNIMIGDKSGLNNTTGGNNLFIGNNSGESNTTGGYNLFIGNESGKNNTATNNMFAGHNSGYSNTTGGGNLFLGTDAGAQNTQGGSNVFVGQQTGVYNTHGNNNTFIGRWSGNANQLYSHDNTYLGFSSGSGQSTGSRNTYIGSNSGRTKTGGVDNTFLGSGTGYNNSSGSSNVFLGYQAGYNETGSNKLYIANSSTSTPLIKGTFPNTDLTFTASVVNVVHPIGQNTNGLSINNTYNNNTTIWRFYQMVSNNLGLYHNTNLRGQWDTTSGAYSHSSDIRLKKNVENLSSVTEKVMKLQPQLYNYNDQKEDGRRYIGLIAQDVENIFPEFVYYSQEDDTYTIDYSGLSVVAIQAIKEQQKEMESMKKEISEMRKLVDSLIK